MKTHLSTIFVLVLTTIAYQVIGQATHAQSSREVWQILVSLYAQTSIVCVLQLKQHLCIIQKDFLSISNYIQKIKSIGNSLYVADYVVSDYELILSALNSLGEEYEFVGDVFRHSMKQITIQEVQYAMMMQKTITEQQNLLSHVNITNSNPNRNNQRGRKKWKRKI